MFFPTSQIDVEVKRVLLLAKKKKRKKRFLHQKHTAGYCCLTRFGYTLKAYKINITMGCKKQDEEMYSAYSNLLALFWNNAFYFNNTITGVPIFPKMV